MFLGRRAHIGLTAINEDRKLRSPEFVPCFKPFLLRDSFQTLARRGDQDFNARHIAHLFLRELFAEVQRTTGERPRHLAIGTPVDCYEPYRAQIKQICTQLGVRKTWFIDEPVAAALGYGLTAERNKAILVVDFGAGTLDFALIALDEERLETGRCRVIAKEGCRRGRAPRGLLACRSVL